MARPPGLVLLAFCAVLAAGCAGENDEPTLFTRLRASETGIAFANRLTDTQEVNVFTYRNYYNGGGVGVGDFDGDGRADLYLTSNQGDNALYLNRGEMRFEDVTAEAGVAGRRAWSTGVAIADVNGDGRLDIYVCNAGDVKGDDRRNELFINEGNGPDGVPQFSEQAEAYGLVNEGYATHAAFFDYDRDGDLDLYVLNNSSRPVSSFGLRNIRDVRDPKGGHKLFRNDAATALPGAPRFTDVSVEAGIYGSEIAFGLGVTVGDVDDDGWLDLYVSNDFFERDYLYLNNRDGTFREALEDAMPVVSHSSMGADMTDLTGDGRPEIFVTDMLPETEERLKTVSSYEGYNLYYSKVANGYHHQLMRNTLQRNKADGTFSEVGQIAGVSATDWSWGALFADLDLDGFKDLFVAAGIFRDVTNQDFVSFLANEETRRSVTTEGGGTDFLALIKEIPSTPLPNYAYANDGRTEPGEISFTNRADEWGLGEPGFSNGAAYADLDDDGDLDLVVNNVNAEASVFRNNAIRAGEAAREDGRPVRRSLQVRLEGTGANRFGVGAKVGVFAGGRADYLELIPQRGFQSSVDYRLTFGLGARARADSLTVRWPDGRRQTVRGVPAGRVTLRQADALGAASGAAPITSQASGTLFEDVTARVALPYRHVENDFVDFHRESLLPRMLSTEGPAAASGDVNGDGLDDLFLGGASGTPGTLLVQNRAGGFAPSNAAAFRPDSLCEDVDAVFFDADKDGDADLYVVSGGNEFEANAPALQDRLYRNDGRGGFTRDTEALPTQYHSGSVARPADVDGDGDLDLFVGARSVPWRYGAVPPSTLLRNDGRGRFSDATAALAPDLRTAGLVTDATWADVDGDGDPDLVAVGEWMPVRVFINTNGRLSPSDDSGLAGTSGWWTRVVAADFDGDGDVDLAAGNLGLNTKLHADSTRPLTMHVADFDGNGSTEQILSLYRGGKNAVFALRNDLTAQLSVLKRQNLGFADYAGRTVEDLFTPAQLAKAEVRTATVLTSATFENRGGRFTMRPLPFEAQIAPIYGLLATDIDGDGRLDLLTAGNFYGVKTDLGRMTASYGLLLRGGNAGRFAPVPHARSGFFVPGQTRRLVTVRTARGTLVVAARNGDTPLVFARTTAPTAARPAASSRSPARPAALRP